MNQEKRKIELYQTRTFSQKISDTFEYVQQNWRPLLKFSAYLLLPLSIVLSVTMSGMMDAYTLMITDISGSGSTDAIVEALPYYGSTVLVGMLAGAIALALCYGCMRLYATRENRLEQLSWNELKPTFLYGLKRMGVLMAISLGIAVLFAILLIGLVAAMTSLGDTVGISVMVVFLFLFATPVVLIPLSLTAPVYLFEDETTAFGSFAKAFRLGFATWGGTFAVLFILFMLFYMASGAVSIPYYIVIMLKTLSSTNDLQALSSGSSSLLLSAGEFLFGVFTNFVSEVFMLVVYVGLAYQYGHACDKIDGTGTNREIAQFDSL